MGNALWYFFFLGFFGGLGVMVVWMRWVGMDQEFERLDLFKEKCFCYQSEILCDLKVIKDAVPEQLMLGFIGFRRGEGSDETHL